MPRVSITQGLTERRRPERSAPASGALTSTKGFSWDIFSGYLDAIDATSNAWEMGANYSAAQQLIQGETYIQDLGVSFNDIAPQIWEDLMDLQYGTSPIFLVSPGLIYEWQLIQSYGEPPSKQKIY
jgi:hypothetical protein